MKVISWLLDQLFPPRCVGCGKEEQSGLCKKCYAKLPYVGKNACPKCGRESSWCYCGKKPDGYDHAVPMPAFQQLTAPFYYEGILKESIGAFKFRRQKFHAQWLAKEMTAKIREQMDISMIDAVVPVPLSKRRLRMRGFNQAALLARKIADELKLTYYENMLQKTKDRQIQHKLSRMQRFRNAEDAYRSDESAAGLRILLIDDVSTTGATLENCAKALSLAQAETVVCCTAGVTKWEHKEN